MVACPVCKNKTQLVPCPTCNPFGWAGQKSWRYLDLKPGSEVIGDSMPFDNPRLPIEAEVQKTTGLRYNEGKVPLDLLDPLALEGLAKVLQFGAQKYTAHNWRGGLKYSSIIGCLLRHLFAILRGETVDKESGLPHIDHVGCNWMFLSYMMKTRPDLDDLWKPKDDNPK